MNKDLQIQTATLRLGFVGTGWIGCSRMRALKECGIVDTAIITDISDERIRDAASIYQDYVVCRTLDEVISMEPDGIVIATPNAFHVQQACKALEAGIPVFCQKPLGRNSKETREVISLASKKNCLLDIDMSYRYLEAARHFQNILQRGEIGEIYAVDAVFHNAYGPDKLWFYDPDLSGGGCLIDLGVHLIDLILWLLGFPDVYEIWGKLFCGGEKFKKRNGKVEDYAVVRMELETGCNVNIACSWNLNAGTDAIIRLNMYGKSGGLSIYNLNGSFYNFRAEKFMNTSRQVLCSPPDDWGGRAITKWAQKLSANCEFEKSVSQIENTALIIDTIYNNAD